MDAVVKKSYFKLLANNIMSFILKKFSLEKIDSNIKADYNRSTYKLRY